MTKKTQYKQFSQILIQFFQFLSVIYINNGNV